VKLEGGRRTRGKAPELASASLQEQRPVVRPGELALVEDGEAPLWVRQMIGAADARTTATHTADELIDLGRLAHRV
jgi:hypothetical protein